MYHVYLITPEAPMERLLALAQAALRRPVPPRVALQLRHKTLPADELRSLARRLRALTREAEVPLLINTDAELAGEVGADGVHLPDGRSIDEARALLGPDAVVGASCHGAGSLERCAREHATFATLSPLYRVAGKAPPLGVRRFGILAAAARIPVLALGGIDTTRVADAMAAGAHGVAVSRAVFDATDPAQALRALAEGVRAHDPGKPEATVRGSIE